MCIADEVESLWNAGIRTTGCCCGHGKYLGFIQVVDEDIEKMNKLGYVNYIYEDDFEGSNRKDAFVTKSYRHTFDEYTNEFQGVIGSIRKKMVLHGCK